VAGLNNQVKSIRVFHAPTSKVFTSLNCCIYSSLPACGTDSTPLAVPFGGLKHNAYIYSYVIFSISDLLIPNKIFSSIFCFCILLHVHSLLSNRLVNKFPRRQILGKQSVARLCNNTDNRRGIFSVVRPMPSARQQNCKHVYNNRRCFLCVVRAEGLQGTTKVVCE
jgi:hypothetical protein